MDLDEEAVKRLLRELDEEKALRQKRRKHSYVEDLINLLLPYKNGLSRRTVLDNLEQQRKKDGLPIPPRFEEAVQSSYNQNCSDYAAFRKRGLSASEAPFYSPGGSGSGKWAVDTERAKNWLRKYRDSRRTHGDETGS
ncbi:MAG: hypothetical protein OXC54_09980 [Rhodospirillaceae bacterium]|nr:hypothetical protein [Rhodospirillaceae bacterium]MCY4311619.1 hypothetical protein [Rhodospirillaceae bacterium]